MARQGLYRGFSSFEFQTQKTFKMKDIELVKMDLLNHIFTKKGQRVMMPNFGTDIPFMIFEPLTADLVDFVTEELEYVVEYDPRVSLIDIQVVPDYDKSYIYAALELFFVELNMKDQLELNIEFEQ
jgi:phage baseplate assembly protein W